MKDARKFLSYRIKIRMAHDLKWKNKLYSLSCLMNPTSESCVLTGRPLISDIT